jgi:hypothetical protein
MMGLVRRIAVLGLALGVGAGHVGALIEFPSLRSGPNGAGPFPAVVAVSTVI